MVKTRGETQGNEIDFNPEFTAALELMENSGKNLFITGRAGTGKSTLLKYFREHTKKKIAVLAPTGVAAVNVEGQTIHSFFNFKINVTLQRIKKIRDAEVFESLDAIVIDEASMLRADLLDCVNKFLELNGREKRKAFGGIQMIFIGDLYQLPPVVTSWEKNIFETYYASPYFFDSHAFKKAGVELVELEKIYRQKDGKFIHLLNSIRNKTVTENDLMLLNTRVDRDFADKTQEFCVTLTSINQDADLINEKRLGCLDEKNFAFQAKISGGFTKEYYPTREEVNVKKGAQVMLLNNDLLGRWINGTIGKVVDITENKASEIIVELQSGEVVEVTPHKWQVYKFGFDSESNSITSKSIGSFTQYPLKLAWAITIHKSQGKTFDNVVIDLGRGAFAHGQTYVALSRCRTLEGIVLKKPIEKKHVLMDWRIVKFLTAYQYQQSQAKTPLEEKIEAIKKAIELQKKLEITYLKASDVKSRRVILPKTIGEMNYLGKTFLGLNAFCFKANDERNFRVDRILELREHA